MTDRLVVLLLITVTLEAYLVPLQWRLKELGVLRTMRKMTAQTETLAERWHLHGLLLELSDSHVTIEAEFGNGLVQQLVGRRTVRVMASGAEPELERLHLRGHLEKLSDRLVTPNTQGFRTPFQERLDV